MREASPAACAAWAWQRSRGIGRFRPGLRRPRHRLRRELPVRAHRESDSARQAASKEHRPGQRLRPDAGRDRACCRRGRWPSAGNSASTARGSWRRLKCRRRFRDGQRLRGASPLSRRGTGPEKPHWSWSPSTGGAGRLRDLRRWLPVVHPSICWPGSRGSPR